MTVMARAELGGLPGGAMAPSGGAMDGGVQTGAGTAQSGRRFG